MRPRLEPLLRESRRARLRRRIHLLPHLFTISNLFAGYFAVSAVLAGLYDHAAIAILVGFVLDALDGSVARLIRARSRIGIQLDSLADVITFGIAPALLAFAWGAWPAAMNAEWGSHLRRLAWIASFALVAAGALRLARFNVTSTGPVLAGTRRDAFVGMPIPVAGLCVAVVVHLLKTPLEEMAYGAAWLVYLFTLAGLMVSRLPFPHFRHILSSPRRPHLLMLVMALLLGAIYFYSEIVLFGLLVLYLSSVVLYNIRRRRGRLNPLPSTGV
jgi:CDP-diacylglycerol--serine O-phosphatidyltransferase